jgi:hypothetical protein
MKCVIHIGMHKTGSTSIQNVLASNYFKEFEYLKLESPNHSVALYTIFSETPKGHDLLRQRGMDEEGVSAYRAEMLEKLKAQAKNCKKTLVISGEVLSAHNSEHILVGLKSCLESHFSEIKIIGYVRSPIAFTQSDFQEGVKGGAAKFNVRQKFPRYRERFEKLDAIFGHENVELVKFSKETLHHGDVVQDFLVRLGIDKPELSASRANESLSLEVVAVLYALQKSRLESGAEPISPLQRSRLIEHLKPIGSSKVSFGKQLVDGLLAEYQEEVAWMEKRLGSELAESVQAGSGINTEDDLLNVAKRQVPGLLNVLQSRYDLNCDLSIPLLMSELVRSFDRKISSVSIADLTLADFANEYGLELHVLYRELGRLLGAKGKRTAAEKVLDEGLRIHPNGSGLRQLRDDLAKK